MLAQEKFKERIHQAAMQLSIDELKKYGITEFARPVARERAKEIRLMGLMCKSTNKYTIKILR